MWSHIAQAGAEEEVVNAAGAENLGIHDASVVAPHNETLKSNINTICHLQNNEIYKDGETLSSAELSKCRCNR